MPTPWLVTRPPTQSNARVATAANTAKRCSHRDPPERVVVEAIQINKPLRTPDGRSGVAANPPSGHRPRSRRPRLRDLDREILLGRALHFDRLRHARVGPMGLEVGGYDGVLAVRRARNRVI